MPTDKEQNSNEQKKQSLNTPELSAKGEKDKEKHKGKNTPANEEIPNRFFSWHSRTHTEKTNLILVILSITSLIVIFYMTTEQNKLTRNALERSDTTNAITRESLEFTKRTAMASDSSTREALRISDSSLKISLENFRTIKNNAQIELRGYLSIDSIYFYKFNVGKELIICIMTRAIGRTPIDSLKITTEFNINDQNFNATTFHPTSLIGENPPLAIYNTTDFILSKTDSVEILNGTIPIYLSLKFTYIDVFNRIDSLKIKYIYVANLGIFAVMSEPKEYYEDY